MWPFLVLALAVPATPDAPHVLRREYPGFDAKAVEPTADVPHTAREIGAQVDAWLDGDEISSAHFATPEATTIDPTLERGAPRLHELWSATAYSDVAGRLQALYVDHGFLSAVVGPVTAAIGAGGAVVRMPVVLGPHTVLYDEVFRGVTARAEADLSRVAGVDLGASASPTQLDASRRKIARAYHDDGFVFARVGGALEPSPDGTRARVVFTIDEGPRVTVQRVEIRGLKYTREDVVRRRLGLAPGDILSGEAVRRTRDQVAALGSFEHVSISIADPETPAATKVVIVEAFERLRATGDIMPGFGLGEGFRLEVLGHYGSIGGRAIGGDLKVRAAYLPLGLVTDRAAKDGLSRLYARGWDRQLAGSVLGMVTFPDVGLGPRVTGQVGAVLDRRLTTEFALEKASVFAGLAFSPAPGVSFTAGPSLERGDTAFLRASSSAQYLEQQAHPSADLVRLLRVPDGTSWAVATRARLVWDRRDDPMAARRGTYFASTVEHVAWRLSDATFPGEPGGGDFVHVSQTLAAMTPLVPWLGFSGELRFGANIPLDGGGATLPDRQFFLGGSDSMRGWYKDTMVPEDVAARFGGAASVTQRGGNLMVNPRAELRVPVPRLGDGVFFGDVGNLWVDPEYAVRHPLAMRAAVGPGIRVATPIGPIFGGYGFNVTRRPFEDAGAWNLAIGLL